jgi:hypothetical protein
MIPRMGKRSLRTHELQIQATVLFYFGLLNKLYGNTRTADRRTTARKALQCTDCSAAATHACPSNR